MQRVGRGPENFKHSPTIKKGCHFGTPFGCQLVMFCLPVFRAVTLDTGAVAVCITADHCRATTDGVGRAELKPTAGQVVEVSIVELAGVMTYRAVIPLVGDVFRVLSGKVAIELTGSGTVAGFALGLDDYAAIEPVGRGLTTVTAYSRTGAVCIRRGDAGFGVVVL